MTGFWYILALIIVGTSCTKDYPAVVGNKSEPVPSVVSTTTATAPVSLTTSPVVTVPPTPPIDTLKIPAPHFSPDGGTFYLSTQVKLTADTLPVGAVIEYSVDNAESWQTGQQFTLTTGGTILCRIKLQNKVTVSRSSALFNLYFKRVLVIGNSIMNHGPAPELGWFNNNGMAASAPEHDFVHLLAGRLRAIYPDVAVTLVSGGNFERQFGTTAYSFDEFKESLQQVQPDLILLRLGENIDDAQVQKKDFENQFRQLLTGLATYGQPVKIVCTTSVWQKAQADNVIRNVTTQEGHALVDLSSMVGQSQYFASQYTNAGVAAHPNDVGMKRMADLIWAKIQ